MARWPVKPAGHEPRSGKLLQVSTGREHGGAGIMAAIGDAMSYRPSRACDRVIRCQRERNRVLPTEKEAGCTDIDEVVSNTSALAAIIEEALPLGSHECHTR